MAAQAFEGKEASEDLGQPLRRQADRSSELALEVIDPSVYQSRLGAAAALVIAIFHAEHTPLGACDEEGKRQREAASNGLMGSSCLQPLLVKNIAQRERVANCGNSLHPRFADYSRTKVRNQAPDGYYLPRAQ